VKVIERRARRTVEEEEEVGDVQFIPRWKRGNRLQRSDRRETRI
jgi:hypothetical protein